jgi:hypothetical protein
LIIFNSQLNFFLDVASCRRKESELKGRKRAKPSPTKRRRVRKAAEKRQAEIDIEKASQGSEMCPITNTEAAGEPPAGPADGSSTMAPRPSTPPSPPHSAPGGAHRTLQFGSFLENEDILQPEGG